MFYIKILAFYDSWIVTKPDEVAHLCIGSLNKLEKGETKFEKPSRAYMILLYATENE